MTIRKSAPVAGCQVNHSLQPLAIGYLGMAKEVDLTLTQIGRRVLVDGCRRIRGSEQSATSGPLSIVGTADQIADAML